MNSNQKISQLKQIIYQQLTPLIDSDYILLDLPYHTNIGDNLIWEGVETFLSELPYKCIYRSGLVDYVPQNISKDVTILLMGGGNFGDVWPVEQQFRLRIIQDYPDNPIIILPQTVYYEHLGNLHIELPIMARHKHLTICARDKYSYDLLQKFHVAKSLLLVPDMAFYIKDERLQELSILPTKDTLLLKRLDKEFSASLAPIVDSIAKHAEIHDWPTVEKDDSHWQKLKEMLWGEKKEDPSIVDEYALKEFLPHMVETGVKFVSQYKEVYTTRLHVGILSVLLHKPVSIIDNSYGKNSQFYDTWLKDVEGVECIGRRKYSWFNKISDLLSYLPGYLFLCHAKLALQCRIENFKQRGE